MEIDVRTVTEAGRAGAVGVLFYEYLVDTMREMWPDSEPPSLGSLPPDMRLELEDLFSVYGPPGGILLEAVAGGEAAGALGIRPRDTTTADLRRLFVRPENRGAGIGGALVTAAAKLAGERGYERIVADVLAVRRGGRDLLAAAGFVEQGERGAGPLTSVTCMLQLTGIGGDAAAPYVS